MFSCEQPAINRDLSDNFFIVFVSSIYKSLLPPSYPKLKAHFYVSLTILRVIGQPFCTVCGLVQQAFFHLSSIFRRNGPLQTTGHQR
jgi:hypothetical protein